MSAVAGRAAYWPVPIVRAIPAIVVGLAITFSEDHGPRFGLAAFGAFAIATGVVFLWGAFRLTDRVLRGTAIGQGIVALLVGTVAVVFTGSGLGLLLFLFTALAAITGFLELYSGLRARGRHPASKDWLTAGAFTAIAAVVFLLVPLDSVQAVGLFGAYAIMIGLYSVIGGLSLKWADQKSAEAAAGTGR